MRVGHLSEPALIGFIAGPYAAVSSDAARPSHHPPAQRSLSLPRAAALVGSAVVDAVRGVASAPAAITLSSGVDSSALLAASVRAGCDVAAITWSMPTVPDADESSWARQTAQHLGVRLEELELRPEDLLPDEGVVSHPSSPVVNIFQSAWDHTAELAVRLGRPTLITGMGGDQLFGATVSPAADLLLAGQLSRAVRHVAARRGWYASDRDAIIAELAMPIVRQVAPRLVGRRQRPVSWLHRRHEVTWRALQRAHRVPGLSPGLAARRLVIDDGFMGYLAAHASAAVAPTGATLAHPLLAPAVVDAALRIPSWLVGDGKTDKIVLREAFRSELPADIVRLRKVFPGAFAVRALRARREQLLELTQRMRLGELGYVEEPKLRHHVRGFMDGEHDDMEFWNTLTLEDWLRRWH